MNLEIVIQKIKKLASYLANLDWSNPRIFLTAIAFGILPFIMKYLVLTGLIIGLCLAVSMLYLVEKSPVAIKRLIAKYPLLADIVLSTISVIGIGQFLGTGLTLALGFIFCDLILAMTLHTIVKEHDYNDFEDAGCTV